MNLIVLHQPVRKRHRKIRRAEMYIYYTLCVNFIDGMFHFF